MTRNNLSLPFLLALSFGVNTVARATEYYWRTDGTLGTFTGSNWNVGSATATGGTSWTSNVSNNANFTANSFVTGASTSVGGLTVGDHITVSFTPSGSLFAGGGTHPITVGNSSVLDFSSQNFSTAGTAGYSKSGGGLVYIANTNAYAGGFILNAGTVVAGSSSALGSGGVLFVNGGQLAVSGNSLDFTSKFTTFSVGGDFSVGGATSGASTNADGGTNATFGDVSIGNITRTITLGTGSTAVYSFGSIQASLAGVGLGVKGNQSTPFNGSSSTGTFKFNSAPNSYTGATSINGASLQFTTSGSVNSFSNSSAINVNGNSQIVWATSQTDDLSGKLAAGTGIANGAVADFYITNATTTVVFNTGLSGGGGISSDGSGTLILATNNSYSGPTAINSTGTLQVGNGGTTGSLGTSTAPINFGAASGTGGTLQFSRSNDVSVANSITGIGRVVQGGNGSLFLSGANTYTRGTTVNSGALFANTSQSIGSSTGANTVTVNAGGTLGGSGYVGNGTNPITINQGATVTAGGNNDAVGHLTTGNQSWKGGTGTTGGTYNVKFADSGQIAGTGFDTLTMSLLDLSDLSSNNRFNLKLTRTTVGTFAFVPLQAYQIADANKVTLPTSMSRPTAGHPLNISSLFALDTSSIGTSASNFTVTLYFDSSVSGGAYDVAIEATPEPTTALLFGGGAISLLAKRRRLSSLAV